MAHIVRNFVIDLNDYISVECDISGSSVYKNPKIIAKKEGTDLNPQIKSKLIDSYTLNPSIGIKANDSYTFNPSIVMEENINVEEE